MATRTFTGTGTFATAARWDGGTLPAADDDLVIDGACTLDANETVTYGTVTVNAGDTFAMATYNFQCDPLVCSGTHSQGVSAGTGLTCTRFTGASGWTRTWNQDAKITVNGNISMHDTGTYTAGKGIVVQGASGTISGGNSNNAFYKYTADGITLTVTGNANISGAVWSSAYTYLNCILVMNTNSTSFTVGGAEFILGSNFVIHGTSTSAGFVVICAVGSTVTNNARLAGTFKGTYRSGGSAISTIYPVLNIPDGIWNPWFAGSGTISKSLMNGTMVCDSINAQSVSAGVTCTADMSTYNPDIVCRRAINMVPPTGTALWTRGTGTITLDCNPDGSALVDFDNVGPVEAIVKRGACTKRIVTDFETVSITGGGGTIESSTPGTQRTITVTNVSRKMKKTRFKDIAISDGTLQVINGLNYGNNTGINYISRPPAFPF